MTNTVKSGDLFFRTPTEKDDAQWEEIIEKTEKYAPPEEVAGMEFVVPFFGSVLVGCGSVFFVRLGSAVISVVPGFFLLIDVNCRHTCILGPPIRIREDFFFDSLFHQ